MSDGSLSPVQHPPRPLRADERELVQAMLSGAFSQSEIEQRLAHALVQDMADGGMGSFRFATPISAKRHFGREAAAAEYIDGDGVAVSITLNLDQEDDLFEVDFWKVNFAPLLRYPRPRDLKLRELAPNSTRSAVAS